MTDELPAGAGELAEEFPDIWDHYCDLGEACAAAGPLTPRERRLVKLAFAIGSGSEGATHSHTRRGVEDGLSEEALRQVALLAVTTLGMPRAVAGLTWIEDILNPDEDDDY